MLSKYARPLETASMAAMLLGIVFLCQPWSEFLHRYSILTIIVGLVAFNVFSRIKSPPAASAADLH
ncbi:MAG: hypothetical protein KA151_10570 [Piscinibacter sp.]|nr:hypothetical protein [Piscinibacter sp.]